MKNWGNNLHKFLLRSSREELVIMQLPWDIILTYLLSFYLLISCE